MFASHRQDKAARTDKATCEIPSIMQLTNARASTQHHLSVQCHKCSQRRLTVVMVALLLLYTVSYISEKNA